MIPFVDVVYGGDDYEFEISPEKYWHGIGPDTASNFYNDFKNDIALMKATGLNSVRTSIQWTRLIDDLEAVTLNREGVQFYNNVIDEFRLFVNCSG